MFIDGKISRGIKAQKPMPVEERIYLCCRGRANGNFSDGLMVNNFTNEYNSRPFAPPEIYEPDGYSGYIYFFPSAGTDYAQIIGTGKAVNTGLRRYLVVEAMTWDTDPNSDKTLYIKFSATTDIEDDGNLFGFTLGLSYKKYYIDLEREGVQGFKYISAIMGLFNTCVQSAIRRIYFTDIKEENQLNFLYNQGNDPQIEWEGWTGPSGSATPGTIETDYIDMDGATTNRSACIISKNKINVSGKRNIHIKFDCTEASGSAIYSNYITVSFYPEKADVPYVGQKQEMNLQVGNNQTIVLNIHANSNAFTNYSVIPIAGEYYMALTVSDHIKMKIKKIWIQ